MPKKFKGENSKAAAARARKETIEEQQQSRKQKQQEDECWQDNDKHAVRKQQKKEEQERKRQTAAERKAETKALLEQEISTIKNVGKVVTPQKTTRAQISKNISSANASEKEREKTETLLDVPLEENLNRLKVDGEDARNVTEAICLLNSGPQEIDKHPEKRMKAAYATFEERRLKILREEQPALRHSQLKQMIFKEWQKSPENPRNCQEQQ